VKRAHSSALCLVLTFGCSSARYSTEPGGPSLVVPAHFAEGKGEPPAPPRPSAPAPSAPSAAPSSSAAPAPADSAAPLPPPPTPSNLPDPTPLRQAEQVEYELELKDGRVRVVSVQVVVLPQPVVTPRRMGRYAIELSIGKELLERLRFDFPGTAADEPTLGAKKPLNAPLTLGERAIARVTLRVPQTPRARRALLVDRAKETATELEWPLPDVVKKTPPGAAPARQP
jgi:hypothetical protein